MARTHWRIGELAKLAHVTVRTLRHYDAIGLLSPSRRSDGGYRLYSTSEVERLYQILLYRELGFGLESIAHLIDASVLDRRAALRAQRGLLEERRRKVSGVIRAVDRMLERLERGDAMTRDELFEGFEAFAGAPAEVREHQERRGPEAKERWGGTDAYGESMRRAGRYGKAEWARIREEAEAVEARMAELLEAGADPTDEAAMRGAEAMRLHIAHWYYPCSHRMHVGLAEMYEADPRFGAHYEKRAEGLPTFVAESIRANAARANARGAE